MLGWRVSLKRWRIDIWGHGRSFHIILHVRNHDNIHGVQLTLEYIGPYRRPSVHSHERGYDREL